MILSESQPLEALAKVVVEEARAACRRAEDRAINEARALVLDAEDRVTELTRAAKELGRTRGHAAETAAWRGGEAEIAAVEAGAFDQLFARFLRHVRMAAKALPQSPRYGAALRAWAARAARAADGPAEVFCAKRDRAAVYEALLAAGVADMHVQVDHTVHGGFVLRDLAGRTLFDARADALVAAAEDELRALLARAVPPPPEGLAPPAAGTEGGAGAEAAAEASASPEGPAGA